MNDEGDGAGLLALVCLIIEAHVAFGAFPLGRIQICPQAAVGCLKTDMPSGKRRHGHEYAASPGIQFRGPGGYGSGIVVRHFLRAGSEEEDAQRSGERRYEDAQLHLFDGLDSEEECTVALLVACIGLYLDRGLGCKRGIELD